MSKHWKDGNYSFRYLVLTKSLRGSVHYTTSDGTKSGTPGYNGEFLGWSGHYPTEQEAMRAVEKAADGILSLALTRLREE